jgi:hypothetical protein
MGRTNGLVDYELTEGGRIFNSDKSFDFTIVHEVQGLGRTSCSSIERVRCTSQSNLGL